jgi:hypothetical protein
MATRKAGSRQLVVDGIAYRWRIRKRATNLQSDYGRGNLHVAVELAENPGAVLILYTDRPHPADWSTKQVVPVRPSDVAKWVRESLAAGWVPSQPGPQFIHHPLGTQAGQKQADLGAAPDPVGG